MMLIVIRFFSVPLFLLALWSEALAGSFTVLPIKLSLGASTTVETLKVKNTSDKTVTVQIKTLGWSQDDSGKDVYTPTNELTYYPRVLTLKKDEERAIKVGYNKEIPKKAVERTFRVFIEEVPQAESIAAPETQQLRIALRMAVPVFVAPSGKPERKAEIFGAALLKGKLSFGVKNTGNVHFLGKNIKVTGNDPSGKDVFDSAQHGWYILTGNNRVYSVAIPPDKCPQIKNLNIEIEADGLKIQNTIDVDKKMCEG